MIELERHQLEAKDQWGLTLAMLAARNGTVSIMKDVLERIAHAEVQCLAKFSILVRTVSRASSVCTVVGISA